MFTCNSPPHTLPPPSSLARLKLPGLDIPSCFQVLLDQYMEDLEASRQLYNKQRDNPPLQRNMPPVAGRISWIRQLYQHITSPVKVCMCVWHCIHYIQYIDESTI